MFICRPSLVLPATFLIVLITIAIYEKRFLDFKRQSKNEVPPLTEESYEAFVQRTCSDVKNRSYMFNQSSQATYIVTPPTLSRLSRFHINYSYELWKTHPAVNRVLSPCEHTSGMNLLQAFSSFCEKHRITFWMIGGTLLGSVRHWDIIPWDRDLDFFVPYTDRERLEGQFVKEQDQLSMWLRPGHRKHGPTKIFLVSEKKQSWPDKFYPFIDIFYYYENETHLWNHSLCCHHHIRKSVIFPLKARPLGSMWLPAPHDPFGYFQELDPPLFKKATTHCHVRGYSPSSKIIQFNEPLIVLCQTLTRIYPFVKKDNDNVEYLILDGKVLQALLT